MKPNIKLKRSYSTIQTLNSYKEYKSYGTQFMCNLLDLCRPNAIHLFDIDILVGIYMYFQKSIKGFPSRSDIYGLNYIVNGGIYQTIFGTSEKAIKQRLLDIIQKLLLDSSCLSDVENWRKITKHTHLDKKIIEFRHYKSLRCIPNNLKSREDLLSQLLTVGKTEKFQWNCNSHWKNKARAVIGKYFSFLGELEKNKSYCYYHINYSTNNREASSWEVVIQSKPNETFTDFIFRLEKHDFLSPAVLPYLKRESMYSSYYALLDNPIAEA